MKKFWIRLALMAALIGIAWANYVVLLHFHPLEYYYTPAGMLITTIVTGVETLTVWPIYCKIMNHWLIPTEEKSLDEEKESIIAEFKDD